MDSALQSEPIRAPDDTGGNLIGSESKCQREIGTGHGRKHLESNDLRGVTRAPPRVQIQRHNRPRCASVSTPAREQSTAARYNALHSFHAQYLSTPLAQATHTRSASTRCGGVIQ